MQVAGDSDATIIVLRVRSGSDEVQRGAYVRKTRITIGRDAYTDIQLDDATVSRVHGVIYRKREGFSLHDRSSNGLRVNGHTAGAHLLRDGDVIEIGRYRVHVEVYADCESSFHDRAVAEGWTMDDARTICAG